MLTDRITQLNLNCDRVSSSFIFFQGPLFTLRNEDDGRGGSVGLEDPEIAHGYLPGMAHGVPLGKLSTSCVLSWTWFMDNFNYPLSYSTQRKLIIHTIIVRGIAVWQH